MLENSKFDCPILSEHNLMMSTDFNESFRELSKNISLLACTIVFNYFQNWLIYCQNKKGISSIGTQCINPFPDITNTL